MPEWSDSERGSKRTDPEYDDAPAGDPFAGAGVALWGGGGTFNPSTFADSNLPLAIAGWQSVEQFGAFESVDGFDNDLFVFDRAGVYTLRFEVNVPDTANVGELVLRVNTALGAQLADWEF